MIFNNYNLIIKLILKKIEELLSRYFNAAKDQIRERRMKFFDLTLLLCNGYFRKCSKWIMCPYMIKYKSSKSISKIVNEFKMILSSFLKHCKFVAQCKERNFLYGGNCLKKTVQLEKCRTFPNELRWQHQEEFFECQQCYLQFSMTWRKQRCLKFINKSKFFILDHCV